MNDHDHNRDEGSSYFYWALPLLVILILTVTGLGWSLLPLDLMARRKAVEASQQYAETNTTSFYDRLDAVKKIDVQIAALPAGDPQIAALQSQKALLVSEMRRAVAKIPADSRTPEMTPYGGTP